MKKIFRTIKARIIFTIVLFATVMSISIYSFSFYMMYKNQQVSAIQSAEFNLQLAASSIQTDFIEAFAFANWCSYNGNPVATYLSQPYRVGYPTEIYQRVWEEVFNSRVSKYVSRVVVHNEDYSKIIHAGTATYVTRLLSEETLSQLDKWELKDSPYLYGVYEDPLFINNKLYLPILTPIYRPHTTTRIGRAYIVLSSNFVTDKLKGYQLNDNAKLFIRIHGELYSVSENGIGEAETPFTILNEQGITTGEDTQDFTALLPDGSKSHVVICPIRDDVELVHLFGGNEFVPNVFSWIPMLLAIFALILLISFIIVYTMNETISKPVVLIRKKMDAIAVGDFSRDLTIESDSEIGEVGKEINRLSKSIVDLMQSKVSDEQRKRDLEYQLLQSQINPHFLYNTLNSIKWMATLQKADGIAEMTTALSRLLRTVAKDLRKQVSLRDEIALLDDYYTIQNYRYGASLTYEKEIDESLLDCQIPRFVLQPITENAIFHGIEPKGSGNIKLIISSEGNDVLISILDDGVGMTNELINKVMNINQEENKNLTERQLGIMSVHERIQNVFGKNYGLSISSEVGKYTKMTLRIPKK